VNFRLSLITSLILAFFLVLGRFFHFGSVFEYIALGLIILLLAYSLFKYINFFKSLNEKFNLVYSGTFSIKGEVSEDELGKIILRFQEVMERVKKYDDIRASRISVLRKLTILILKNIKEYIGILDHEKEIFYVNEALKNKLNIEEDEFKWQIIINNPDNLEFKKIFEEYILKKENTECKKEFYFPSKEAKLFTDIRIIPVKDEAGSLARTIFIFGGNK